MKKMHLPFRLLSLLLVLALLGGFAAPIAAATGLHPGRAEAAMEALAPEETPQANIGYMEEVLQNLVAEATYQIQGSSY